MLPEFKSYSMEDLLRNWKEVINDIPRSPSSRLCSKPLPPNVFKLNFLGAPGPSGIGGVIKNYCNVPLVAFSGSAETVFTFMAEASGLLFRLTLAKEELAPSDH